MEDYSIDKIPVLESASDWKSNQKPEETIDISRNILRRAGKRMDKPIKYSVEWIEETIREFFKSTINKIDKNVFRNYTIPLSLNEQDMVDIVSNRFYDARDMAKLENYIRVFLKNQHFNILPDNYMLTRFDENYIDFDIVVPESSTTSREYGRSKKPYPIMSVTCSRTSHSTINIIKQYEIGTRFNRMREKIPNFQYTFGVGYRNPFILDGKILRWDRSETGTLTNLCLLREKLPDMNVKDYIKSPNFDMSTWINIFMQVFLSLHYASVKMLGSKHGNLDTRNVYMKRYNGTVEYEMLIPDEYDGYETTYPAVEFDYMAVITGFENVVNGGVPQYYIRKLTSIEASIVSGELSDSFEFFIDSCRQMRKKFKSDEEFKKWDKYEDLIYIYKGFFHKCGEKSFFDKMNKRYEYEQLIDRRQIYKFVNYMYEKFVDHILGEGNNVLKSNRVRHHPMMYKIRSSNPANILLWFSMHVSGKKTLIRMGNTYIGTYISFSDRDEHSTERDLLKKKEYNPELKFGDGIYMKSLHRFFNESLHDAALESFRYLEEYDWPPTDNEIRNKKEVLEGVWIASEDQDVMTLQDRKNIMIAMSNIEFFNNRRNATKDLIGKIFDFYEKLPEYETKYQYLGDMLSDLYYGGEMAALPPYSADYKNKLAERSSVYSYETNTKDAINMAQEIEQFMLTVRIDF